MSQTALDKFMRKDIMDSRDTDHSKKAQFDFILQKTIANMSSSEKTFHHRTEDCQILELL